MRDEVWLVQHVREYSDGHEDIKLIGVYSSRQNARAAVARLRSKPGFVDHPRGFHINSHKLDLDGWTEGFVRV